MGEGTTRIANVSPERLEGEIATIRGNIVGLVREIEQRRKDFLDWRNHRLGIALAVGGLLLTAGLGIAVARRRGHPSARDRLQRVLGAYSLGSTVVRRTGLGRKIIRAAVSTLAATLVRSLTRRAVESRV